MEGGLAGNTAVRNSLDKSEVLDVKPLRSLLPVFPGAINGPPFATAPPNGTFPSGFSPFPPFSQPQGSPYTPVLNQNSFSSTAVPIRSFSTELPPSNDRNVHSSNKRKLAGSSSVKKKVKRGNESELALAALSNFKPGISAAEKDDGNRELVENVLMRQHIVYKRVRTNGSKRIGVVPGVEIGDIYFFRMELILVGVHAQSMAGIDSMPMKGSDIEGERVAVSIVSSGGYEDDAEDPDVLVYTGQGGNANADKEASDQKLVRGNLALERSLHRANEVRVIRGFKDPTPQHLRLRISGQNGAFSTWKSIQKWRADPSSREGLTLPDLTSVQPSVGCNCSDACQPGNSNCSCNQKNSGDFPYIGSGILVCRKPMIYECGSSCPCNRNCKNRVSQTGFRVRFEVFKTRDRGWGLRSWDPIRAGTFLCVYAGEAIENFEGQSGEYGENNDFVFHTNRVYESFRWNHETESAGEGISNTSEVFDIRSPLVISSKNIGNVARFLNHSCSPNVFWQPITYDQNHEAFLNIAFFTKKHIPPMTELTYDYGTPPHTDETGSNNADCGKKKCLCESPNCRGYFY
ncbi:Heat shock protein 70 (Hsp 70) family protein isoform 1 [Hibiscus syriacus]|uniref:Heat shock protein 70 (Hsp 70) family protein isoform 1 n=1 Tax=Hibiscus syriacus TaxID=106335 RepID=A0A6A3AGV1_HIBSY|nr:Heat shock protein 70 (Hsp 70) family protein isoform 1 [Hibiscus syriacus]